MGLRGSPVYTGPAQSVSTTRPSMVSVLGVSLKTEGEILFLAKKNEMFVPKIGDTALTGILIWIMDSQVLFPSMIGQALTSPNPGIGICF